MNRTVELGGRRRQEEMKFVYSGPFAPLLNPIRTLPITEERYSATSAERYTIETALPRATVDYLVHLFGRESGVSSGRLASVVARGSR